MIVGLGHDLTDIRRIEKTLARFGTRFIERCFTKEEIQEAEKRKTPISRAAAYAKRFAAKEACSKALGTGFSGGILMKEISVQKDLNGRPILELTGHAAKRLATLTPDEKRANIHLTISDELPIASAIVIIEAI